VTTTHATPGVLVGLDLGTTACKASVVGLDGSERSHGRAPTPWVEVPTGAEVEPDAFAGAALTALAEALARVGNVRVLAIGIAGIAETGVLLDRRGRPVVRSIAWYDSRGEDEARSLAAALGEERFLERTGQPVRSLCSAAKYRWLRDHEPHAAAGVRWLGIAEWMAHLLGGEQVADLSLASRSGLLDLDAAAWWDEALAWAQAPPGLMPPAVVAGTPLGRASGAAGPAVAGATIAVAGLDHLAASIGVGAIQPGDLFDSCGTAEALIRAVVPGSEGLAERAASAGLDRGWHSVPGLQVALGAQPLGLMLGAELERLGRPRAELEAEPDSPEGRRWREACQLAAAGSRAIADELVAAGGPLERTVLAGGWSTSPALRTAKQALLERVERPAVREAGARGAALVAGLAAGVYASPSELPAPPREG
jgi:sugar (pentulose or hexulose) kinase